MIAGQARYHLLKDSAQLPMEEPTMESALRGATLHPAPTLRRDDLGRIQEGAQADLVAVDVSGFLVGAGAVSPEPLNKLLCASGRALRHVMTGGVVKVRDGQLQVADGRKVRAGWRCRAEDLVCARAGRRWPSSG